MGDDPGKGEGKWWRPARVEAGGTKRHRRGPKTWAAKARAKAEALQRAQEAPHEAPLVPAEPEQVLAPFTSF